MIHEILAHASRCTARSEQGSSLPELLVAAGLTLVALSMLSASVLAPLAGMTRAAAPDDRLATLERAGDEVISLLRLARPGLEAGPLLVAGPNHIEIRGGGVRYAAPVSVLLEDGTLRVERDAGLTVRTLVTGLDPEGSMISFHGADGQEIGSIPEMVGQRDIAVVTLVLADPPGPDGSAGRRVVRTIHLGLRLPLAADGAW
jgi:hypothetical protein